MGVLLLGSAQRSVLVVDRAVQQGSESFKRRPSEGLAVAWEERSQNPCNVSCFSSQHVGVSSAFDPGFTGTHAGNVCNARTPWLRLTKKRAFCNQQAFETATYVLRSEARGYLDAEALGLPSNCNQSTPLPAVECEAYHLGSDM